MAWIFFDTATPKRGVQLSHDIESVTCEDKAIKIYFKEDGPQTSLSIVAQPSRARRLPILVSFPSKEDANTAFVGMAEEMAKETGNWFIFPTPEPKGPFTGGIGSDNRTYPFTNEHGKHFRIEHDEVLNSIIIAYEDGVNVRHTLDELPHAGK